MTILFSLRSRMRFFEGIEPLVNKKSSYNIKALLKKLQQIPEKLASKQLNFCLLVNVWENKILARFTKAQIVYQISNMGIIKYKSDILATFQDAEICPYQ